MLRRTFERRNALRGLTRVAWAACALSLVGEPAAHAASSQPTERIATNDNRKAAGELANGTLTIRLEARSGEWRPDREDGPGVVVHAFAVEGRTLQIPAPLIRVIEGTQVRAFVRNSLGGAPLFVRGLYSRPGKAPSDSDTVLVPTGETREIKFLAGSPGTYYYWAATEAAPPMPQRAGRDSQLTGAFIVEPRGGPSPTERVLLIGNWNNGQAPDSADRRNRIVINGRSWPHTERLAYKVGDVVRMRLINAGAAVHPMHLHGFYFNVDSRGDERADAIFASDSSPHLVVTERLAAGRTFALTWKPTRPGNWLFHCHDNVHLEHGGSLDGTPAPPDAHRHVANHALEMMAGPVMGITVTGKSTEAAAATGARRQLQLVARVDTGGTDAVPAFGYTMGETKTAPPYIPGPTIVLKRGEPVSITVRNELPEPTAVHWHGIELESYYDGVAGYAGDGKRIAPAISPGGSFEARFTPPRSGTFIYHTHIDEVRQQQAGLSGPLLVLDAPETYDPAHDMVLMVTVPRTNPTAGAVLLNGSATPVTRELRVGERYRLRFINLHTFRPSMRMRLLAGATPLRWRALAKDGMDLPDDQAVTGPSEVQMGNGETYDFDFVPSVAGDIRLDVTAGNGNLLVTMPIRVR